VDNTVTATASADDEDEEVATATVEMPVDEELRAYARSKELKGRT
jgi:hypothetical protein